MRSLEATGVQHKKAKRTRARVKKMTKRRATENLLGRMCSSLWPRERLQNRTRRQSQWPVSPRRLRSARRRKEKVGKIPDSSYSKSHTDTLDLVPARELPDEDDSDTPVKKSLI